MCLEVGGGGGSTGKDWSDATKKGFNIAGSVMSSMRTGLDGIKSIMDGFTQSTMARLDNEHNVALGKIDTQFNAELAKLEQHEAKKLAILDAGKNSREELNDDELNAEIERERERFELEKERILESALTEETRRVDDAILEQDWLNKKQNIIKNFRKKETKDDTEYNKKKEAIEQATKAKKEALETAHEEKKKAIDREFKRKKYDAEKKQFETDKAFKLTQAWLGLASGIATIWATAFQLGPIAGPIMAGINTAILIGTTAGQTAVMASQQPPPAPEFATGGVLMGAGTSTSDSLYGRLSRGEAVIDASRTNKLFDAIDGGMSKNIVIQEGSIVINTQTVDCLLYTSPSPRDS